MVGLAYAYDTRPRTQVIKEVEKADAKREVPYAHSRHDRRKRRRSYRRRAKFAS